MCIKNSEKSTMVMKQSDEKQEQQKQKKNQMIA